MQPSLKLKEVEALPLTPHPVMNALIGNAAVGATEPRSFATSSKSMRCLAASKSTRLTSHGACRPRAAVNRLSTSRLMVFVAKSWSHYYNPAAVDCGCQVPLETAWSRFSRLSLFVFTLNINHMLDGCLLCSLLHGYRTVSTVAETKKNRVPAATAFLLAAARGIFKN